MLFHLRNFLPASQHALHAIFEVLTRLTCHNRLNVGDPAVVAGNEIFDTE